MIDLFSERPFALKASRTLRLTLGGHEYELPVLTIGGNRRWKEQLDRKTLALLDAADTEDPRRILALLSQQTDDLLDLLRSYDETNVLPDRTTLEDTIYEDELVVAVREVWRAANPFVASAIEEAEEPTPEAPTNGSPKPTSSAPRNTAGRRRSSKKH